MLGLPSAGDRETTRVGQGRSLAGGFRGFMRHDFVDVDRLLQKPIYLYVWKRLLESVRGACFPFTLTPSGRDEASKRRSAHSQR